MLRLHSTIAFSTILLASSVLFNACKSEEQKRGDAKQELIENISHYGIEPVDTTGKTPLTSSADANDVLCHYPEFYHAIKHTNELHAKWAEAEQRMVCTAFVGKSSKRVKVASQKAKDLTAAIEDRSIAKQLDYVLFGTENPKADELPTLESTADFYLTLMASVADGMTETADHASTDDIKTAIGFARRMWTDYAESLLQIVKTVPEPSRARYILAVNNIVRRHLIDLKNRYYTYCENDNPAWLLTDEATDDNITNFEFQGYHNLEWFKQ